MADDDDFGFSTPRLEYLSLKRKFLSKYLDRNVWEGEFGSKELLVAISSLLQFFMETKRMADDFPELENDVIVGNKDLVMQHILPLPPKLYEQVVAAVVEGGHQQAGNVWQQPASEILSRIEQFLTRYRSASLACYEHKVWSDVHDLTSYTSQDTDCEGIADEKNEEVDRVVHKKARPVTRTQLRRQRKKVYASLSNGKSADRHLRKYRTIVKAFLQRNESELSLEESSQLKLKLKRTEDSVRISSSEYFTSKGNLEPKFKALKPSSEENGDEHCSFDDHDIGVKVEEDDESKENDQLSSIQDQAPFVLPDVPEGDPEEASESVVDIADIERRLTRLKFFSEAWVQPTPIVASNYEPSRNNDDCGSEDIGAVISTKTDRLEFNQWYYDTVDKAANTGLVAKEAATAVLVATEAAITGLAATEAATKGLAATEAATAVLVATEAATTGLAATEAATTGFAATEAATTGLAATEAASREFVATETLDTTWKVSSSTEEYNDSCLSPSFQFQDSFSHLATVSNSDYVTSAGDLLHNVLGSTSGFQFTLRQAQQQDLTFMFLQAILVMLVTMSRFLHVKLDSPASPWPGTAHSTTVTPTAVHIQSSEEVSFQELLRSSRILASQWIAWVHVAVLKKLLMVITGTRNVLRSFVKKETWLKVRAAFLAKEQ